MAQTVCVCGGGGGGGLDDPLLEFFFSLRLTRMVGAPRRFGAQLGDQQGRAPRRAREAWSRASQGGGGGVVTETPPMSSHPSLCLSVSFPLLNLAPGHSPPQK